MTNPLALIRRYVARRQARKQQSLRGRIFISGQPRESRPSVLAHLKTQIPDVIIERDISNWLYPKE